MKVLLGTAAAIAAAVLLWPTGERLAPYRFPVGTRAETSDDVALLEARASTEGLDLAALARAYLRRNRIDEAEAAARRSLDALPVSNPGAILVLAQAAQMKHDFRGSIALCDQVPPGPRSLAIKATAQLGLGDLSGAIATADALVDRAPISEHLALRAVILAARGDEREALHDFRKAVTVEEPGDPEGSAWLRSMWARLELRRGRHDRADDLLQEALRIHPASPLALGLLGDLELDRGRRDAAERAYADAYQASGDPVFLARRAFLNRDLLAPAEKALREAPGHGIQLAQVLLERGAVAEALSIAEKEARSRRNVETLETLGRALAAAGRVRDARAAVREALRSGVPDARLHRFAADLESRLGAASRAGMHLEAAREIRP